MATNPTESLMAAHRAVMENAQTLGMKSFEAATRLFEMQTQAAQGLMGSAGATNLQNAGDPMAVARGATEYTQRVAQLLWETQTEMMRLMQSQAMQLQQLFSEMMATSMQQGMQAASDAAQSATGSGGGSRRGKSS